MLKINPKIISCQNNYSYQGKMAAPIIDKSNIQNDSKFGSQIYYDDIAFKGCFPSPHNRSAIKKIVNLITSPQVKKIAIFSHTSPDLDAIGSSLGLAHMIKEQTGKTVDVFVLKPLSRKFKLIYPNNEIKVVSELIKGNLSEKKVLQKFGQYDMAIGVDTAQNFLFDDVLYNSLFSKAKHKIKIDHHPVNAGDIKANYADINLVDVTKESAAQLVMEFVAPLGINPRFVSSNITEPLTAGLIADSCQFKAPRSSQVFKDAAILSETANVANITSEVNSLSSEEFADYVKILSHKKLVNNGRIAYCTVDVSKKPVTDCSLYKALEELGNISGVRYSFIIITKSSDELKVSVRSKDKSIRNTIRKLGGDGHHHSCSIRVKNKPVKDTLKLLIEKLTLLDNSIIIS